MKLYFGKTTMTHGLKGELKLYTDFSRKDLVLQKGFPIEIKKELHRITSVRPQKNHFLITIDDLNHINLVERYRNCEIYISREDLPLKEVIIEEILGYEVYEDGILLGKVKELRYNTGGILLEIEGKKSFLLPYQENFIQQVLPEEQKILVQNAKGLIL